MYHRFWAGKQLSDTIDVRIKLNKYNQRITKQTMLYINNVHLNDVLFLLMCKILFVFIY